MEHVICTGLSEGDSKKALNMAFETYANDYPQYKPHFKWKKEDLAEFGFAISSVRIAGFVLVIEDKLIVNMNVPFIARPFQGRAIAIIEEQVLAWKQKVVDSGEANDAT